MKRFNITMSDSLYKWYLERSQESGVTISALMNTVLDQYRRNGELISSQKFDTDISRIIKIMTEVQAQITVLLHKSEKVSEVIKQTRGKQRSTQRNPSRQAMRDMNLTEKIITYIILKSNKERIIEQILASSNLENSESIHQLKDELDKVNDEIGKLEDLYG